MHKQEREYSILYAPLGKLATTTQLDHDLVAGFMNTSQLHALITITDAESKELDDLSRRLDSVFGTPPGMGMSALSGKETISQTPEWILERYKMNPDTYIAYLLDDGQPLEALNKSVKSALCKILRMEKLAFLPRVAKYNMGSFDMQTYAGPPSIDPVHYLKGRLFLRHHGNHLIVSKE